MMMVALSPDAKEHLDQYLKQIRMALAGRESIDADEVERDVLSHIDAELSGTSEPVPAHRLLAVLDRLGEPNEWVPAEEAAWRRPFAALSARPGDWRLAAVSLASLVLTVILMTGRVMLWPLPLVLLPLAFVTARINIALLDDRREPIGLRTWLLYPVLLAIYVPLFFALIGGTTWLVGNFLSDDPSARSRIAAMTHASPSIAAPALVVFVLGCWWILLGLVVIQTIASVRALFRPFAGFIDRRHAVRLTLAGLVLALIGIATLTLPRFLVATVSAQGIARPDAKPVDPVGAILDAFRTHPLVAVADAHGNEQVHAFRLALIRDPRLAGIVNDVVVEFGTARYQDVIDQFIRGEDVPYSSLRRVWEDTTQIEFDWDLPIYEELLRAIRSVNAARPPAQRLRVVLGDPPMDWENIHSSTEYLAHMSTLDRDEYAVEVIRREVLAKNRRALVIYGGQHLLRKNAVPNANDEWARGLVAQLERPGIASLFTIDPETRIPLSASQADITQWRKPSLALLTGTRLGQMRFTAPAQRLVRFEEQFDAVVYLGEPDEMTTANMGRTRCDDAEYMQMRTARLSLLKPPAGAPVAALGDLLRRSCEGR
jgi:hypothetical protein